MKFHLTRDSFCSRTYSMRRNTISLLVTSRKAHGTDAKAEAEAIRLRDAWTSHPDHTILKAMVAERAIFFVLLPLFRFCGDAGMRTTSADISETNKSTSRVTPSSAKNSVSRGRPVLTDLGRRRLTGSSNL